MKLYKYTPEEREKKLETLHKIAGKSSLNFMRALSAKRPRKIEPGQLWITRRDYWSPSGEKTNDKFHFVVILKGPEYSYDKKNKDVEVVVLNPESAMATRDDLILPENIPHVGGWMACFWNTGQIYVRNLDRYLGVQLDKKTLKWCEKVWARADGLSEADYPLFGVPTGPPVKSNIDDRTEFQKEIKKETVYLWEPVDEALSRAEARSEAKTPLINKILNIISIPVKNINAPFTPVFDLALAAADKNMLKDEYELWMKERKAKKIKISESRDNYNVRLSILENQLIIVVERGDKNVKHLSGVSLVKGRTKIKAVPPRVSFESSDRVYAQFMINDKSMLKGKWKLKYKINNKESIHEVQFK